MAAGTYLCHNETDLDTGNNIVVGGVFNDNGGTDVLRLHRIGVINMDDGGGPDGDLTRLTLEVWDDTVAWTPGSSGTIHAMDTSYSAGALLVTGYGGTPTTTSTESTIRTMMWDSTPVVLGAGSAAEWETFVPFGVMFDGGYHDTAVQPITLRADQACFIFSETQVDNSIQWYFEVTEAAA
jgi:hypothetical protein